MCWADAYCNRPGCTGCVCSGCGKRHHGAIGHGPPCSCPGAVEEGRKHAQILGEILAAMAAPPATSDDKA
jgi:hypothetical protein